MNVAEQTELYSEYIEQVRKHNEANDTYSSELKQLADERSSAIEAAITQHMTELPQLSKHPTRWRNCRVSRSRISCF